MGTILSTNVQEILGVPERVFPARLAFIACPNEDPPLRPRLPLAACDGAFPEPVVEVSSALVRPGVSGGIIDDLVEQISRIGHHSGIAMLSGLTHALTGSAIPAIPH